MDKGRTCLESVLESLERKSVREEGWKGRRARRWRGKSLQSENKEGIGERRKEGDEEEDDREGEG